MRPPRGRVPPRHRAIRSRRSQRSSRSPPQPRGITPGRNPSNSASAVSTNRNTAATPSADLRSTAIDRRLRAKTSFGRAPPRRIRSTRITSAPMSDNIMPQKGPGPIPASSMIRKPCNGPMCLPIPQLFFTGEFTDVVWPMSSEQARLQCLPARTECAHIEHRVRCREPTLHGYRWPVSGLHPEPEFCPPGVW